MYASPSPSERLATAAGSVAVVALVGYALVTGLSVPVRILAEQAMPVLALNAPPPPPPERRQPPEPVKKAERMKGDASPRNLRNVATPVVAPPKTLPVKPPVIATLVPNIGAAASNGASDRPGPGQGAGGTGNGFGGGGDGAGDGDGDDTPPRQIRGRLGFSDMPAALRAEGIERTVEVRYAVNVDGRVSNCSVTRSSGSAELDATTCRLIEDRFRYRPSLDSDGRPVRSIVEQQHSWRVDRATDEQGG